MAGPGLKMYFLLNMGIFQPAMLVFQGGYYFLRVKFESFSTILDPSFQIIATSHDLGPQKVVEEGKSPCFREI